jgi:glycosyltransferase involved in cell wall biosynthesis
VHIVQLLPELQEGGVERGTVEMNREMVRRGVTSTVISRGGRLAAAIESDGGRHITLDICSKNPLTVPWRVWRLRRILRELRPDIVHVRSRLPAWLLRLANRPLRIPVVSTVHGFNSVGAYSRIMTQADRVICVSHAIHAYIRQHYQTPLEQLRVIHRGIDPDEFDPARLNHAFVEQFRRAHALEGRYVVTSVGRVTPLKDYETFIRAVAAARPAIPNILGLIVGGTRGDRQGYEGRLHALVDELQLGDAIRFVGSQRQIAEIYHLSDVVVSSSRKPESFGRAIAEALAMETPVVASRHGGALEIVREGFNGRLFTPGDADDLARCLIATRQQTYAGLRADAVQRFALGNMVESTLEVYHDLLGRRPPCAPLRILLLFDGKAGHMTNSMGVLRAVERIVRVEPVTLTVHLRLKLVRPLLRAWLNRPSCRRRIPASLQLRLIRLLYRLDNPGLIRSTRQFDWIMSAGGDTSFLNAWLAALHGVRNEYSSALRGLDPSLFTLWLSRSAGPLPPNAVPIHLVPTPIDRTRIAAQGAQFRDTHHHLGDERLWAVLVGGDGAGYRYTPADMDLLAQGVLALAQQHQARLLLTTSRRTGPRLGERLKNALGNHPAIAYATYYHVQPEKVVAPFLGTAEAVFCTADSEAMITETMTAGKPLYVLAPERARPPRFYQQLLREQGEAHRLKVVPLHGIPGLSVREDLAGHFRPLEQDSITEIAARIRPWYQPGEPRPPETTPQPAAPAGTPSHG